MLSEVETSSRRRTYLLQLFHEFDGFIEDVEIAVLDVFHNARLEVVGQHHISKALQRALHGGELDEYVAAISIVGKHFFDAAELPDDAIEPIVECLLLALGARRVLVMLTTRASIFHNASYTPTGYIEYIAAAAPCQRKSEKSKKFPTNPIKILRKLYIYYKIYIRTRDMRTARRENQHLSF